MKGCEDVGPWAGRPRAQTSRIRRSRSRIRCSTSRIERSPSAGFGVQNPPDNAVLGCIPARAGEPRVRTASRCAPTVHPRACGGTSDTTSMHISPRGASPRVRGNPAERWAAASEKRCIPARAGEPRKSHSLRKLERVHPRACGGTASTGIGRVTNNGASPRVRGNPPFCPRCGCWTGCIPARAGEPLPHSPPPARREVHPRACGGTHAVGFGL